MEYYKIKKQQLTTTKYNPGHVCDLPGSEIPLTSTISWLQSGWGSMTPPTGDARSNSALRAGSFLGATTEKWIPLWKEDIDVNKTSQATSEHCKRLGGETHISDDFDQVVGGAACVADAFHGRKQVRRRVTQQDAHFVCLTAGDGRRKEKKLPSW